MATLDGQEVPGYGIYAGEDWSDQDKGQAAMITRMDSDIGERSDLADQNPKRVKEMEALMKQAHQPHPNWQPRGRLPKRQSRSDDR